MTLTTWHAYDTSVRWRCTPHGVEVEGDGLQRTPGEPRSAKRVWIAHRAAFQHWAARFCLPVELLMACALTETTGDDGAVRIEPGYRSDDTTPMKISAGLMQTLIGTAREVVGVPTLDRAWLLQPRNSLHAGAGYIRDQASLTKLDPPLVAAAYNAGGLYKESSPRNRWRLRQHPIGTSAHVDRFCRWLGDAVAVVRAESVPRDWDWFLRHYAGVV